MKSAGRSFDLSPAAVVSIKSGYTDLVLDQQPFLQDSCCLLGLHIDTGGGLVGPDNIDFIAPLAEKGGIK